MKEQMSSRERFLTAVRNQVPDRVPACPCLWAMVPVRRTGKPFWDIFYHNNPPLWKTYLDAVDYYGIDGRFLYGGLDFTFDISERGSVDIQDKIIEQTDERLVVRRVYKTEKGDLDETTVYMAGDPPTKTVRVIKDIVRDLPAYKCLCPKPVGYTSELADEQRREAGERAAFCLSLNYPGFHFFNDIFDGGLPAATYAYMDHPEIFENLRAFLHDHRVAHAEQMLDYGPDILYLGGSGTLTLSSPEWVREFTLPTIKALTKMAKEADIPTMLHSCGKSSLLVEMFANETDLSCINPLEQPPMGDADLKEVKEKFGDRLALSGNILTTEIMLMGSPKDVDDACRQAIEDAGEGGGFLLMSGDQCGRDTPDENIFAFVEAAKRHGKY